MKNFNSKSIAASVLLGLFSMSSTAQEAESVTEDAASYLQQIGDTIVTQELIDEARRANQRRDQLRDRSEIESLEDDAISSEISKLSSQRDLITLQFIVDNVPPYILAAGQSEVQSYINRTFINETENDHSLRQTAREPRVVWSSSETALTTPYQSENDWIPVINDSNSRSRPTQATPEPEPETEVVAEPATPEPDREELSREESQSLNALGITEEELARMFGDLPTEEPSSNNERTTEVRSNATIDKMEIDRVVIMGRSSFVDVSLTMKLIRGSDTRNVKRDFSGVGVGYEFEVDGNTFMLESLNSRSVTFINKNSGAKFQERVK